VSAELPDGYGLVTRRTVQAFAWSPVQDWLEGTLARDGTLQAWGAQGEGDDLAGGRGGAAARAAPGPGPTNTARWVSRHYRRGGWVAPLLGDRYAAVGIARPFRELAASVAARARGVLTPAVVAGAVYRAGFVYRADLVTEEVPDARSLADWLRASRDGAAEADLLRRAGRAVRGLERARVVHADANAGNILMAREGPAWVVDLDRAAVLSQGAAQSGTRMRGRLERSLRKLYAIHGLAFGASAWDALRAGYEDEG
jgi:3-deoxy-D-manno-octulosonic acid kinase